MAYDPPRERTPKTTGDPLEVELVFNVRPCGTCNFFWPAEHSKHYHFRCADPLNAFRDRGDGGLTIIVTAGCVAPAHDVRIRAIPTIFSGTPAPPVQIFL